MLNINVHIFFITTYIDKERLILRRGGFVVLEIFGRDWQLYYNLLQISGIHDGLCTFWKLNIALEIVWLQSYLLQWHYQLGQLA